MFVLANDKKQYICKTNYQSNGSNHEVYGITTDYNKACKWDSPVTARKVKKNQLKQSIREGLHVLEIITSDNAITLESPADETEEQKIIEIEKEEIEDIELNEDEIIDLNNSIYKIFEKVGVIDSLLNESETELMILHQALSITDKEISDIYHWIELSSFNARDGYKISALLKEKLVKRRKIKNSIEILTEMPQLELKLKHQKNKKYAPRELKDLFEGRDV